MRLMYQNHIFIDTWVKTAAAVDQERQGTTTNGFGQFVAANDAI